MDDLFIALNGMSQHLNLANKYFAQACLAAAGLMEGRRVPDDADALIEASNRAIVRDALRVANPGKVRS